MKQIFLSLCLSTFLFAISPECYKEGYKELIKNIDSATITLYNGEIFPYHTNTPKETWEEKINNADLQMQISQVYQSGNINTKPEYLFDPGRLRYQPFFEALYGKNKQEIEKIL